jgi:hypothetical protein
MTRGSPWPLAAAAEERAANPAVAARVDRRAAMDLPPKTRVATQAR